MAKRTRAPGQPARAGRVPAPRGSTPIRAVPSRRSQQRPHARYRTPHRPTLRRQPPRVSVALMRQDLTFLLVLLMIMLVVLSPLMKEALVVFDKLLPFLTLVLGHYFGQK